MPRAKKVTARRLLDFDSAIGRRHLINVTVGVAFDPVILTLEGTPDYRLATGYGSFPKKQADTPNSFRIHHLAHTEGVWTTLDLPPTPENYFFVQAMPEEQWLLVRSRAGGVADRNAHLYSAAGGLLRSFHAGDGIADVQATAQGRLWISYFDEGVFGSTPLGTSGLACLDRRGRPLFRFTNLGDDPLIQSMADCYALNVCSDRETWLYYYTDFPLVRLVGRQLAGSWAMPIAGSHGFAVDGQRVLLAGSYSKKSSLFLGVLATLEFQELTPVNEKGAPIEAFRGFGRGRALHLATAESLYSIDLNSL
jgi:hypothetical protein